MRKAPVFAVTFVALACSDVSTGTRSVGSRDLTPDWAVNVPTAPSSPGWQQRARELVGGANMSPLAASRVYAALSIAQYQAVTAVDDVDVDGVVPQNGIGAGGRSALEARRGAVAGASAQVLKFFFAGASASFDQRVDSEGKVGPGNVHPQYTRGVAIGRIVGDAMVERTKNDRFTVPFTGTIPVGPGKWVANGPPAGPTFGGVKTYLIDSGDQFRPAPPPAFGSPAFLTDVAEIKAFAVNRTQQQVNSANYWNFPTGSYTPIGYWNELAARYVEEKGADERAATHTFALMHAAVMDAMIGCWDAKYYYWTLRPTQADPTISLVFALPNHPSYPSGHSCSSSAAASVLSHFYADKTSELGEMVTAAGLSRMYAGIHYRFDITAGQDLGHDVAAWAIARDESVGLLSAIHW